MLGQVYNRASLVVAVSIGLGLATISTSLTLAALTPATTQAQKLSNSSKLLVQRAQELNKSEILAAHNQYRKAVGATPLKWSDSLASSAQEWALELASNDSMGHSSTDYGENIWAGTAGAYSPTEMVDSWGEEKQYFVPGNSFPDSCQGGDCGHYTQIIWSKTKEVGCGLASSAENDYFVCQYNPPGNYQGQEP
ncbi:MAG: CAP domain-containing protein [Cyanobacteriota bacterium]